MSRIYDIIKRPIVTEKTTTVLGGNKVVFEVALDANKNQIREAVERLFDVTVEGVNTSVMAGKRKRTGRIFGKRSNWKKAVITLKDGDQIDFFAGTDELSE